MLWAALSYLVCILLAGLGVMAMAISLSAGGPAWLEDGGAIVIVVGVAMLVLTDRWQR